MVRGGGGNSYEVVGKPPVLRGGDTDWCTEVTGGCWAMLLSSILLSLSPTDTTVVAAAAAAGFSTDRPVRASQMRDGSLCNGLACPCPSEGCKDCN